MARIASFEAISGQRSASLGVRYSLRVTINPEVIGLELSVSVCRLSISLVCFQITRAATDIRIREGSISRAFVGRS
jgi:hypothetical protein